MSRGFRERIAVSLLGAAVLMAAVLGVMTIRSYTQPASTAMVQQGDVSGAQSGASPAAMPNAPGSTQTSGGGPGGGSGGEGTNRGLLTRHPEPRLLLPWDRAPRANPTRQ